MHSFLKTLFVLACSCYLSAECYPQCGLPNLPEIQCQKVQIFGDVLVWNAAESGMENWGLVFSGPNIDIQTVEFDWNVGFRGGIDYALIHDEWDTKLYYTWFHTAGSAHAGPANGGFFSAYLGNFYINNPNGANDFGAVYQSGSIHWDLHFNTIDWELGRAYWVSSALVLRPFFGLKGGWIDQKIDTRWQNPIRSALVFTSATEDLKQEFWCIGPSGGFESKWKLISYNSYCFSLFGDFSGALLWGKWTFDDVYTNDAPAKVLVTEPDVVGGTSMLRGLMGFQWDLGWERLNLSLKAGYEAQFWFEQLRLYIFNQGQVNNVLTLQGGSFELNLNF